MPKEIFSESFFNLPHPSTPFVSIQFRSEIDPDKSIDDPSHWKEVTFNPNNFLNSLELEDTGGAYKLNLNLYDKNYSFIEDTVVQTLFKTKLANKLVKNPEYSLQQEFFEFFISRANSTNLRIRIGYSEFNINDEEYVSVNTFSSEDWRNRANTEKTVLKTPWIYFQVLKTDFKITAKGLELQIEAFSIMNNFLKKAKLVETYSRFFGRPKDVIDYVCNKIVEAASRENEKISFDYIGKDPVGYPSQENAEEIIEIMLGGTPSIRPDGTFVERYKSLEVILREICSAVRPLKYDLEGNEIPFSEDSAEEQNPENENSEESSQIFKYSYFIEETEEETKIFFYYQDARFSLENQRKIRTYTWIQDGLSIVKDLELQTQSDFAMLSLPVVNIDESTGDITARTLRSSNRDLTQEDETDFRIGNSKNATAIFENVDLSSVFAGEIINSDKMDYSNDVLSPETISLKISDLIRSNLDQQVVRGNMTIFGDPFYLFDSSLQPFTYIIKILINRPNFVDNEGNFVTGGKSYLSGFYLISKINHSISVSGFETKLELIKFNSFGK